MQFTVRSLALAGEGNLRLQVAALARKLEAEGLMRPERKRALPRFPQRIAVVTSPRGKAVHDVMRTLRRRYPLAELLVAGVAVEGEGAPAAIVEGLRVAGECRPDVVLLVRGGGSYEDLMPFNAEEVARAVVACPVPVVTGIGHEPDTSIADMVADCGPRRPRRPPRRSRRRWGSCRGRRSRAACAGPGAAEPRRCRAPRVARLAERPVLRDPHAVLGLAEQTLDLRAAAADAGAARASSHAMLGRSSSRPTDCGGSDLRSGREPSGRWAWPRRGSRTSRRSRSSRAAMPCATRGWAHCGQAHRLTSGNEDRVTVRVGDGSIHASVTSTSLLEER